MRFRYKLVVEDAEAKQPLSLVVECHSPREIRVLATNNSEKTEWVVIEAITEVDVNETNMRVLRNIIDGASPVYFESMFDTPQEGLALPRSYEDLTSHIMRDLHTAARKIWQLLLWRFDVTTGSRFITGRGLDVFDNGSWHQLPTRGQAIASVRSLLPGPNRDLSVVQTLADTLDDAPLAHDLLHEARELRSRSPRAALITAVVALEVGFKNMVSKLLPTTGWLMENIPSPPIEKMLREWLPTLPVRNPIEGSTKAPSERILSDIRKGVLLRNQLVHRGHANVSLRFLEQFLTTISDCLRLFDYYLGYEWASRHMDIQTIDELDLPEWRDYLNTYVRK